MMTDPQKSSDLPSGWKRLWSHGLVLGLGLALVGFVVWFLIKGTPSPSAPQKDEQAPQTQAQSAQSAPAGPQEAPKVPAAPAATLKSQLERVLAGIRAANQEKNLSQLLSHYSPNFPQLTQRAQSISKTWKIFDYSKMEFTITEVKALDDHTAVARVTWDIEARNISTHKYQNISKSYLIRFVRESDQWRIKALDKIE